MATEPSVPVGERLSGRRATLVGDGAPQSDEPEGGSIYRWPVGSAALGPLDYVVATYLSGGFKPDEWDKLA